MPQNHIREIISNIITKDRLRRTQPEKYCHPPPLKGNTDIDKTEHEPFRHPAVKTARRKKADRKNQKKHHGYCRGSAIDTSFPDTELYDHRHCDQACRQ